MEVTIEHHGDEGVFLVEGHQGEVVVQHQALHHTIYVWDGECSLRHKVIQTCLEDDRLT